MRFHKLLSLLLAVLLLMVFSGAALAESANQPEKAIHLYTNRSESHPAYQLWMNIIQKYQQEVNPNFKVEVETVANLDQYKDKLKLYIAGNELPEIFQIDKGPIAQELAAQGKLVNIESELQRVGMLDKLNEGCRKYVEFEDGRLFILPESRYGNTIFYWKDKFEAAGITETPKTFDEFLTVCQKLKDNGEIPVAITGKASWNPLHLMYLPSWTVTGNEWLKTAKKGETKFADEPTVWDAVNFLYAMAQNKYFPAGFGNIEYTDVMNGFLGGQYAMAWAQSLYIPKMEQLYDEGKLGFMTIPTNGKYPADKQLATMAIQTGISWAFNQETYDAEMQRFFEFVVKNYSASSYELGLFSPFDEPMPDNTSQMSKDYYAEMAKQTICWVNWDDACDPVTCQTMDDLVKELTAGMITPEDFVKMIDESVAENGVSYFQ